MSSLRCRLGDSKVEKQVCIAHNYDQFCRKAKSKRSAFDNFLARFTDEVIGTVNCGHASDLNDSEPVATGAGAGVESSSVEQVGGNALNENATTSLQSQSHEDTYFEGLGEEDLSVFADELELKHNVWDFKDPQSIIDSVLFNDTEESAASAVISNDSSS